MIAFTILGQAASKANSRKIVENPSTKRLMVIKSKAARQFMDDARRQIPPACRVRMQGPVAVVLHMHYRTELPDLDESVVLDALQDHFAITRLGEGRMRRDLVQAGIYCNDRQVRWKLVVHHIDRLNPRVEVQVAPLHQLELFAAEAELPF